MRKDEMIIIMPKRRDLLRTSTLNDLEEEEEEK
jgi:hypothetical protein